MPRLTLTLVTILAAARIAHAQPAATPYVESPSVSSGADATPGWTIEMGSATRWMRDRSAGAVTTDPLSSFVMSFDRRVATFELPHGFLLDVAAEATWANGEATGTIFQTLTTDLGDNEWLGGVHATARILRTFGVSARAAAGVTRTDLAIAPESNPEMKSVDDHGWGRIATATIGGEFQPVHTRSFALGVGLELGWVATSSVTMHAYPSDRPDPDLSIETAFASIGHLDLHGFTMRIGVHASF
jgi:hypothetical protein